MASRMYLRAWKAPQNMKGGVKPGQGGKFKGAP